MTNAPDSPPIADAEASLEEPRERQAEVRDVVARLREAGDREVLSRLLDRLVALLEARFEREEESDGSIARIGRTVARRAGDAEQLVDEHHELLAVLRDLRQRLGADPTLEAAAVEDELRAILDRLEQHDLRQREMLADALDSGAAAPVPPEATRSQALEVNLRRTAVNVVIPPEQRVLLEITADLYGVHENTKKLLREINHRYVGWRQTLEDLHRRAMGDFGHYVRHPRAPEAVEVFGSCYAKAAEQAVPAELRETAVRNVFYYLEKVAREAGEALPALLPPIDQTLVRLGAVLRGAPRLAAIASPRLRRFAQALATAAPDGTDGALPRALDLLADTLREVYDQWLACEDPADWWREAAGAAADAPLPAAVAAISHGRLQACRDRLLTLHEGDAAVAERAEALFALPDNARIERGYLEAASCLESEARPSWQNRLERIQWLIRVLAVDALATVHEQALSEISHSYGDVLRGADRERLVHFVRETFDSLRRSRLSSSPSALHLIEKIGVEVLATGDPDWAEAVIGEMLDWEFPGPGFSGFTDEWQVRIDPAHLRAIRAYLAVAEASPALARPLIAGLVVHLKLGGVFVADTDLFQKDISRLLNSGIGGVYHPVKHLLKLFPVYFSDIGAEGELRDVSSRIDELTGRRDPLCHFLRKQCHVESNPLLIGFLEATGHFWATGDREPLRPYVPASLYDHLDLESEDSGVHEIFRRLVETDDLKSLFALPLPELERRLEAVAGSSVAREKAALLFRLRKLIGQKYELDHADLLERLTAFHRIAPDRLEELRQALEDARHESALEILIEVLEQLKEIIVSEQKTRSVEDIYHKRHIAVGIPSMYGRYREEKFEAVGLTFRIESLANVLFERMVAEHNLEYITRNTLERVARWLRLALRALRIDGCQGRGLSAGIAMLEQALVAEGISVDQHINVLQVISRAVEQLIRIRFLDGYEPVLERVLEGMLARGQLEPESGEDPRAHMLKVSEAFLRDLIAQSFGLQLLDELVGKVLRTLVQGRENLAPATMRLLMTYDADRCFVEIDANESPLDGAVYLGNKGYTIKRLARDGIPVPDGFILTTEFFRCHAAILACEELRQEVREELRRQVARLERLTGSRFGDAANPLLISVRSGAAMSMPGMLDTFLNVGMNEKVAEGRAALSGSAWGAWDAYRRFLQFWGMGHGVDRDLFDALMGESKRELGVLKKSEIAADDMKQMTFRYRDLIRDQGIDVPEDPFEQLNTCVELVLNSWHSEKARVYRRELQIAEEWGTAVVVQNMVYGNLNDRSGTGVVMTCDPHRATSDVHLYGDFVVQGQGDDVVSGLVDTYPISEAQRLAESPTATLSLEKGFPRIYREIDRHARTLIYDHGMFHQEIEFTFESDDPADLYILQSRDTVMSQLSTAPTFVHSESLEEAKLATGIGAGGGALSGRVAHTADDIAEMRRRYPGEPVILLRPDTVPDDVPLILQADGMVTARGGATSHAAVAAQRIGRTCVVGCRDLEVREESRRSSLAGRIIETGDLISINGIDGSIYLGSHPSTVVHRGKLA